MFEILKEKMELMAETDSMVGQVKMHYLMNAQESSSEEKEA